MLSSLLSGEATEVESFLLLIISTSSKCHLKLCCGFCTDCTLKITIKTDHVVPLDISYKSDYIQITFRSIVPNDTDCQLK